MKGEKNTVRRVLREPLLHFFLIGSIFFVVYYQTRDDEDVQDLEGTLVVRMDDFERLRTLWTERWKRPPASSELRGIVDDFVREEVLYREALELGLDENDVIVRRRLAQKITFLTQDLAAQLEPGEEELRDWFAKNLVLYAEEPLLSFTHIYFNEEERGSLAESEAESLLDEFSQSNIIPDRAPERGDRFMLRYDYQDVTPFEIRREFGNAFGDAVIDLTPGTWHGPIRSGYGVHLVRLIRRTDAQGPTFEEVRDRVEGDWLYEQSKRVDQAYIEALRKKYNVVLDDEVRALLAAEESG